MTSSSYDDWLQGTYDEDTIRDSTVDELMADASRQNIINWNNTSLLQEHTRDFFQREKDRIADEDFDESVESFFSGLVGGATFDSKTKRWRDPSGKFTKAPV